MTEKIDCRLNVGCKFQNKHNQRERERERAFFAECLIHVLFLNVTTNVTQKMAQLCTVITFINDNCSE